jgi:NAD(P)-dependent dehydrogenase (short-subunit alcohol dehydrogenase family)
MVRERTMPTLNPDSDRTIIVGAGSIGIRHRRVLESLGSRVVTMMAPDIRVNSLSPGGVFRNQDSEFVRRYEERTPLGRMATEEDLTGPVLFLASDLSRYITGHDLVVDGGFSVW